MTTITWDIANLDRELSDGHVFTAYYTVNATDGTYYSSSYGSVGLERPESLVPFDELTKELVLTWVKETLGEDTVSQIESSLIKQIEEQSHPVKASGVPW